MRRLLILGLFAGVALGYLSPPFDASRIYLYPYWATNPRLDSTHYPWRGYFALFGSDSTKGSLRIFNREATGKGIMWRLVSGTADTTRIDSLGIWTNGDLWAQTVHYTTLDPPAGGGNPDTFKMGYGQMSRGTFKRSGDSIAGDSATWRSFGNTIWLGLLGKAADASGADSADVGVVSRSCTGNAATVTTIAGKTADTSIAAGRATTASSATGATFTGTNASWTGTDTSLRRVSDTSISGIWRSKTSVVTGAGSAAFGVSCTTGTALGATVSGGIANVANADSAFVGGGGRNRATGVGAVVAGGQTNTAGGATSFIGGGLTNQTYGVLNVIAGGWQSNAIGNYGTIGGGRGNTIYNYYTTIAGGYLNTATIDYSTVGGGTANQAYGYASTVPGGIGNLDSAPYSFALGCSLRVPAADSFSGVIGFGAGSTRLVGNGKRTLTFGITTRGLVIYNANDSTNIWGTLNVKRNVKVDSTLTTGTILVGDTVLIRTAGAAFAATKRFQCYVDSCVGVDSIQLTALNATGARARVLTLRDSVFVKDGATVVKILGAAGKWADFEYLGAPCSRWCVFGSN